MFMLIISHLLTALWEDQVDSSTEGTSSSAQSKASGPVVSSRFGRFGFGSQLLQKTVGLVLRPRSDKQVD
jgi:hypothetical protein